ncbi:hypothetical protein [Staphylococcus marylandisciuri]|uniref:hypothetical protein n=1 Tax=Staphylococcus marylandisciuri TaxID=2981529 RepID=UPI0021CE1073|nr:hypothetical protein [Staphylococcus marylandisciuri]
MGWGPNKEKLVNQFQQALRVGVGPQQRETGKSVSTSTASWGGAPTKRERDRNLFIQIRFLSRSRIV